MDIFCENVVFYAPIDNNLANCFAKAKEEKSLQYNLQQKPKL